MNNLINNSYKDTIKYLKLKCKYLEAQCSWLDELANYERDANRYEKCEEDEAWSKEIDELYLESVKLRREYNEYQKELLTKTK
jgi:hypothetical protein